MGNSSVLVTGGSGFFGGLLRGRLLAEGYNCISVDLVPDNFSHPNLRIVRGDICDRSLMEDLFSNNRIDTAFHCAAILAHAVPDKQLLWSSNVDGTQILADMASRHGTRTMVFISSNCLWAHNMGRAVREDDAPCPVEIYGQSKWEGEKIVSALESVRTIILRSPTIIDEGRLGLLAILFEFIDEGRKVWVVGGGHNRYQFIYAQDLATACIDGMRSATLSGVFNIGSDNVRSLRDVYQYVIDRSGSRSRIASLPRAPAIAAMKLAHSLGLSPLGPYQYRMIAEDFEFDTSRIKEQLGWRPTLTNEEMLWRAYDYYSRNRKAIELRTGASAHRSAAKMGIIRLLKWMS